MFRKIKTAVNTVRNTLRKAHEKLLMLSVQATQATAGEMYVDTAAKVLIACVIGMLLLVSFYAIFKTNIIPNVTKQVTSMFTYSA